MSWAVPGHAGLFRRHDAEQPLREWLEGHTITGHNFASFDLAVIAAAFPQYIPTIFQALEEGRVRDSLVRQKLLDIAGGIFRGYRDADGTFVKLNYSLADLMRRHLKVYVAKGEDTWRLRYKELENTPLENWPPEAVSYAVDDAKYALAIHDIQERARYVECGGRQIDLLANEAAQCQAAFWMQLMSCWGMRVHPDKVAALEAGVVTELEDVRGMLLEEGLIRAKTAQRGKNAGITKYTRDTKAAAERMVRVCAEEQISPRMTPAGGVCLDEDACTDSGDPVLEAYSNYASLQNVLSKDVLAMRAGEIHGQFDSLVASLRSSCRGFNLQNLRRKGGTRGCFVPRDGFDFLFIDLDTAELRAVGQVCIELFGFSTLAEKMNDGADVHCYLASKVCGASYEEVLAGYKADDERMCSERQSAKNSNFGLWGGMREKRFRALIIHGLKEALAEGRREGNEKKVAALRKSIEETTEGRVYVLRQAWLQTWTESKLYLDLHERLCGRGKTTTFEQAPGVWRGNMRYSEACNSRFQSRIAAAMKAAGFVVSRACYDPTRASVLYGSRILTFPHDELVLEVPSAIGHECAQELQRLVLTEVGKFLPNVPPKATPYLARYWSKAAKPVYDTAGRLIPWDGDKKLLHSAAA